MKVDTAFRVLKKEQEFLGLTWEELCIFIQRNPYAQPQRTIKAFEVFKSQHPELIVEARNVWEEFECVLCGENFNEYGNNPYPWQKKVNAVTLVT